MKDIVYILSMRSGKSIVCDDTVNGTIAGQNADGDISYFTTDLLGSVRTTTDGYGYVNKNYTYDVFGAIIEGDLSGKQNYGYRDYTPKVARFTTVDPIRDGENWVTYCNNDSVNQVDLDGRNAIPDSEKIKKASINDQIEYYQKQYDDLLNKENLLKTNIEQKEQEKKEMLKQRKEAYKETGYVVKKETAEKFLLSVETYPDGTSKDGGGYQIHLTSTTNTDGCLGIHDEQLMNQLIDFYCKNEEKEPGTAKLKVKNK